MDTEYKIPTVHDCAPQGSEDKTIFEAATNQLEQIATIATAGRFLCEWRRGKRVIKASIASKPLGDSNTLITKGNIPDVMSWIAGYMAREI